MRRIWSAIIVCIFTFLSKEVVFTQDNKLSSVYILAPASTASTPLFVLAEKDPLENVDIIVKVFINHPQALVSLYRKEAQFLFSGTSLGWENRLGGAPIIMVTTGVWGVSYLIGKEPLITDFAQLKGKKIALPFPGSPLDFQTRYILHKNGINPDRDVELSYAPFTQITSMLLEGLIDAAPLPEPLATNVIVHHGLRRLVDYKKAWAGVSQAGEYSPQVSLFATADLVQQNRDFIIDIENAWRESTAFTIENPRQAATISARYLSMPINVIETAIINTLYAVPGYSENRKMVIDYYHEVKDFLPGKREMLPDNFFFSCE
ncbi:MAG: ABC transporter substrate-binding protein [Spirochaetota bacterium]|nr:MAG: ABC transporter substrate-binding protein [Spirochaetota bacterium]